MNEMCVCAAFGKQWPHSRNSTSVQFRGPTTAPARRLCASANRCTGGMSHTYAVLWSRNTTRVLFRGVGRYIRARNTTRVLFRGVWRDVGARNCTCVLFRRLCSAIWENVSVCDVPLCGIKSRHNKAFEQCMSLLLVMPSHSSLPPCARLARQQTRIRSLYMTTLSADSTMFPKRSNIPHIPSTRCPAGAIQPRGPRGPPGIVSCWWALLCKVFVCVSR